MVDTKNLERKPSPGSSEATAAGCECPVDENRAGQGVAHAHFMSDGPAGAVLNAEAAPHYCISQGCPIHGFSSS